MPLWLSSTTHSARRVVAQLVDQELELVLADAEREVGHEPSRVGDRRVRKRLADDRRPGRRPPRAPYRGETPLAPARLRHVLGDEVAGEAPGPLAVAEELAHALERRR